METTGIEAPFSVWVAVRRRGLGGSRHELPATVHLGVSRRVEGTSDTAW